MSDADELLSCSACPEGHTLMEWRYVLGMVCGRCGQHTGNNNQGHYWGLCAVLLDRGYPYDRAIRAMHFCCPGDCQLEAKP